ncbi:MAG TPA: GNAT family N-acetyltransferase [Vulgatibacter sp.]|nr:GNAT family N-acetyltransferase [Vulgatibacter sp.]
MKKDLLDGEKVFLRPVEREDLAERVAWINDEEIHDNLNFDVPVSLAKTEKWFDRIQTDGSRRDFSVFTRDGRYIGFSGLVDIDPIARKAEMYAAIGIREYRRGGYGTDVYRLLTNYGFVELGLERIYGYQLMHSAGSQRVVEKLGWTREGLLRQDVWAHGRLNDRFVVSILRAEWEANPVYRMSDPVGAAAI